jgi:hypothetical protein
LCQTIRCLKILLEANLGCGSAEVNRQATPNPPQPENCAEKAHAKTRSEAAGLISEGEGVGPMK